MASIDLLDGLNAGQREAVTTVAGPLLVLAGPGSGKTRVIVHRIAYMVLSASINPGHILAVTFSKKATEEMRRRLDALLGETAPAVTVSTIHSACLRMLRREGAPGLGTAFEVCDDEEQNRILKQCMQKVGLDPEENSLRRLKTAISYAKTNLIDADSIVAGSSGRFDDSSLAVFRTYQRALKRKRVLDYDDMLVFAQRMLAENGDALRRYQQLYRYLLVDEFQDTSSLQYRIVKQLGARYRNVCVVGDPDQTIYSWRQAEMRNIDQFRKDFPGARIIGLCENYRSTQTIVSAANALIERNKRRKEQALVTSREQGRRLEAVKLADEDEEARFIASTVNSLLSGRRMQRPEIAVLYRVNVQSRALEDAFLLEGIQYRLATGTPFYKRKEITDMTAMLRVLRNPSDDSAVLRVIKLAGRGIGAQSLDLLRSYAERHGGHLHEALQQAATGALPAIAPRAQRNCARLLALVTQLRAESRRVSTVALINAILERTDYRESLKDEEDADERWENVMELISLASAYEHLSPLDALSSLLERISAASTAPDGTGDPEAVAFNTLHGSKGTEFKAVFIAGVEEGLLPHGKSLDDPERLEEERRLCYVGITRAMDQVYLTYTEKRRWFGEVSFRSPSRFIGELPAQLVLQSDLAGKLGPSKTRP